MSFRQAHNEPSPHAHNPTLREYQLCQLLPFGGGVKGDNIDIAVWDTAISENKLTTGQLL